MTLSALARRTLRQALGNDSIGQEIADRLDEPGVSASTMIDALDEATSAQSLSIRQSLGMNGYISVKDYGAVGNGRVIYSLTNSGSTVTGPSGTFSQSDVGKTAWCTNTSGASIIAIGTVSSVSGTTQATLSGSSSGNYSGVIMYLGTDDTTAIQDAWSAAKAAGRILFFPAGNYFTNRQVAGVNGDSSAVFGVLGEGSTRSRIVMMQNFASTGAVGNGIVINITGSGLNVCSGIGIDGGFKNHSLGTKYVVELNSSITGNYKEHGSSLWVDVCVENIRGFLVGFYIGTSYSCIIDSFFCYNGPDYGFTFNGFSGQLKNCWSSNGSTYGMAIVGGSDVSFYGCLIDEHGWYTLQVQNSTARFRDSTIYGGIGAYCIELQGTGKIYLDGCRVEPFSLHANSPAILTASGTTVYARNSTITSTGTGKCVTGAGTLIDEGGNTFTGTVDVTTRKGMTHTSPQLMPTYTVSTLPSASANANGIIIVSNESGGAVLAFSDGTNWRRVTDRAIVS